MASRVTEPSESQQIQGRKHWWKYRDKIKERACFGRSLLKAPPYPPAPLQILLALLTYDELVEIEGLL